MKQETLHCNLCNSPLETDATRCGTCAANVSILSNSPTKADIPPATANPTVRPKPSHGATIVNRDGSKSVRKKTKLKLFAIWGILLLLVVGGFAATEYVDANPVVIWDDGFAIHMHERGIISQISSIMTGGYEVRFYDITNIELLPYSASDLGDMIDDLRVPAIREGGRYSRVVYAGYVGNYRLHVFLGAGDRGAPTIWITRYESAPILLSFRQDGRASNAGRTERLYSRLVAAWGGTQTASTPSVNIESAYPIAREATEIVDAFLYGRMTSGEANDALQQLRSQFREHIDLISAAEGERLVYNHILKIREALRNEAQDDVLAFQNSLRELINRP